MQSKAKLLRKSVGEGKKKRTVLVFGAHNDDQLIGVGGTIANYTNQGIDVIVYVFSFGEQSHPHLRKKTIAEMRVHECHKSDKVLGITKTVFLGLQEGSFEEDFERKKLKRKIQKTIREVKPEKIFLHTRDDPHPDHRSVNSIVYSLLVDMSYKGAVYSYDVWNPLQVRERNLPRLVVDISDSFTRKVRSFFCHESQKMTMFVQVPFVYVKAIFRGLHYGYRYAEVFYKIR